MEHGIDSTATAMSENGYALCEEHADEWRRAGITVYSRTAEDVADDCGADGPVTCADCADVADQSGPLEQLA